jgi:hypothetical protein
VVRVLEDGGAIETAPYCPGVKARGFRLTDRYLADRCVRRQAVDPGLIARLEAEQQRLAAEDPKARWLPIHHMLDEEQRRLTIDVAAADAILEKLPAHCQLCQAALVGRLRRREFHLSVGNTGRVFNSLTGLKRELRRTVRIDGEPLAGVDIACAQPALLALEMARKTPSNGLNELSTYKLMGSPVLPDSSPPSCCSFADLVLRGQFYESLVACTGLDRDRVKLAFLRDVLAKRGRYPSVVEDAFRSLFPTVYKFVRSVNRDDHAELIRQLQRRESWLVVERVAPRLVGRVPCVTLHDAIYTARGCLPVVETAFNEVFDEIGFHLTLKRETG